jgi:hypothetical protein
LGFAGIRSPDTFILLFWRSVMGLFSGLYDLFAGDPAKKEEDNLEALSGYDTATGEGDATAASKYYQDILSGDPSRIASSLAPEISSGQTMVQQQRNQNSQFGSRSGGNTASTANAEGAERGNIINLEGGLQKSVADSAGSLGSNLVGQATANTNDEAALAERRRASVDGSIGGIEKGAAQIAAGFLDGGASEGGADSYSTLGDAVSSANSGGLPTDPSASITDILPEDEPSTITHRAGDEFSDDFNY